MDLGEFSAIGRGATTASSVIIPNVPGQGLSTLINTTSTLSGLVRTGFTDHILRFGVNFKL